MLAKRTIRCFLLSMVFLAIATLALLMIPIWPVSTKPTYILAAVFWAGLLLEQAFFWLGNAHRKEMERRVFRVKRFCKEGPGIFYFGSNRMAAICDCVMLAALIAVVLEIVFRVNYEWLDIFSLALLFLSFNLHCILNGTNVRYLLAYYKHKKERRKS